MLIYENITLAIAGLKANKLRTFLTMLGIMIGIASVIAIMLVGDSMKKNMLQSYQSMGVNTINIGVQFKNYDNLDLKMTSKDYITPRMIEDLKNRYKKEIAGISLSLSNGEGKAEFGNAKGNISLIGVNSDYLKNKKLKMIAGRTLTDAEQTDGKRVGLVSDKLVKNLFHGDANAAIGKSIDIQKNGTYTSYTIIGVYEYVASEYEFYIGKEEDRVTDMYLPIKNAIKENRQDEQYSNLEIIGATGSDTQVLSLNISNYLNQKYYAQNDNFLIEAFSMDTVIQEINQTMSTIKLAIAGIAGISLLVGGIGVMNIMMVTITERTREIGTRKALGATNQSIRVQFITEAIVICLIGGIIGVILGLGIGFTVTKIMGYVGQVSLFTILGSVLFSVCFGVFFGYYPANKAAKLNPIEALRYE